VIAKVKTKFCIARYTSIYKEVIRVSKSFTVAIQKESGWLVAKCLENNVVSQGKTMDEAVDNLREALALYYENEAMPVLPQTFVTTLEVAL